MEEKLKIRHTPREKCTKKEFCSKEILLHGMRNEIDISFDDLIAAKKKQDAKERRENPEYFREIAIRKKLREAKELKAHNEEMNRIESERKVVHKKRYRRRKPKSRKVIIKERVTSFFRRFKLLLLKIKSNFNQSESINNINTENNNVKSYIDFADDCDASTLSTPPPPTVTQPIYRPISKSRNYEDKEALCRLRRNQTALKEKRKELRKYNLKKYKTDSYLYDDEVSSIASDNSSLCTIELERGVLID